MAWMLTALKLVLELTKDSKTMVAGMIVISGYAWWYGVRDVNAKYATAMAQIEQRKTENQTIATQQQLMMGTVTQMNQSLSEIKSSVQNTENRVWQISRDVYMLRTGKTPNQGE